MEKQQLVLTIWISLSSLEPHVAPYCGNCLFLFSWITGLSKLSILLGLNCHGLQLDGSPSYTKKNPPWTPLQNLEQQQMAMPGVGNGRSFWWWVGHGALQHQMRSIAKERGRLEGCWHPQWQIRRSICGDDRAVTGIGDCVCRGSGWWALEAGQGRKAIRRNHLPWQTLVLPIRRRAKAKYENQPDRCQPSQCISMSNQPTPMNRLWMNILAKCCQDPLV